jgi:hypothetical protein
MAKVHTVEIADSQRDRRFRSDRHAA